MNDREITRYIHTIEERYPVNEWQILGRYIWPLVRMNIYSKMGKKNSCTQISHKSNIKFFFSKLWKYRAILANNTPDASPSDVMIFHHNVSRILKLDDGTDFDINLDPFTLMLEDNYTICSLENMDDGCHKNLFRKSTYIDGFIIRAVIYSKTFKKVKNSELSLKGYDMFLNELPDNMRKYLEVIVVYRSIICLNKLSIFFADIIKKKEIKLVIAGCGYGIDTAALFMACKDTGVQCMEVQHGLAAGNGHCWYSKWNKMPIRGGRYEMLPDIYWCWTKSDEAVLKSWGRDIHTVYMGGKPIYSVISVLKELTATSSFSPKKKLPNILFSLQPGVSYPKWISDVVRETCNDYNWIVRKHPRFDEYQAELIKGISGFPNVYVKGISSIMLEKLLICTDLHITNHSTIALDALEFNVKSIILDIEHAELFSSPIESHDIFVGTNKKSFLIYLRQIINNADTNLVRKRYTDTRAQINKDFLSGLIKI